MSLSKLNVVQHKNKFPVLVSAFTFSFCRELVGHLILYLRSVVNTINKSNKDNTMNQCRKQNEITKELGCTWSMQSSTFHFCVRPTEKQPQKPDSEVCPENLDTSGVLKQPSQLVSQFCFDLSLTGQSDLQLHCLDFDHFISCYHLSLRHNCKFNEEIWYSTHRLKNPLQRGEISCRK